MQEHKPKVIRTSVLLCLFFLSLLSPFFIREYERRMAFQWKEMVQPRWQPAIEQPLPIADSEDVADWKDISSEGLGKLPEQTADIETAIPNASKNTEKNVSHETRPTMKKNPGPPKVTSLKLKLPDNLYEGKAAEWEDKSPAPLPDFFSPKQEAPSRVQLGGRIIVDEDKKKQEPDAGYLDTVKGAEINISISTP